MELKSKIEKFHTLEDNRAYQDFEKRIFINKLSIAIDQFIAGGDTFLNCYTGCCNSMYECHDF